MNQFERAISRFDAANAEDPNKTLVAGQERPEQVYYAERMTRWLQRLEPAASEVLRLAARSQHLRRWEIPRDRYPLDRAGYHQWRKRLYEFHAEKAAEILRDVGYDEATIDRVGQLLRKQHLKTDPEMQLLEDVACLVFLEDYFSDFSHQHDEETLVRILGRTWKKMSPRGREAALQLDLDDDARRLIEKASQAV